MRADRIVNIRFLFCVFVGLMCGILVGKLFLFDVSLVFVLVLVLGLLLIVMLAAIFYSKHLESENNNSLARKNIPFVIKCSGIGMFVACVVGVLCVILPVLNIQRIPKFENNVVVTGQIVDAVETHDTYVKFYIGNVVILNGEELVESHFDIEVFSNSYASVSVGDYITISAKLNNVNCGNDFGFNKLVNGIGYTTYVNSSDIILTSGKSSLKSVIQSSVFDVLSSKMSEDNANICFAILFGEKSGVSQDITDAFSYAGISHILAVSGLHVGVLVMIVWFFIDKLKINKYIKLVLFVMLIIFYMYLCSFSPSVSRAGIMAIVLVFCKLFHLEYDSIGSLSLAGILILLISPLSLFSISFQLSFMCIFAIITLVPTITRWFLKLKLPRFLAQSLAVSLTLSVAIMPICAYAFAKVSLLGVLANILVIPIFTVTYILLFCIVILSLVFPFLSGSLILPEMFLHIIKVIAGGVAAIPFGVFKVFSWGYIVLLMVIVFALILHFFMSKHYLKYVAMSVLWLIIIVSSVLNSLPKNYDNNTILIGAQYNTNICVIRVNDKNIMLGSNIKTENLIYFMKEFRLNSIDSIVAYDLQLNNLDNLNSIKNEFGANTIYASRVRYEYLKDSHINGVQLIENTLDIDGVLFEFIEYKSDIVALKLTIDSTELLILSPENNKTENTYLLSKYESLDGWICMEDIKIDKENSNVNCIFVNENDSLVLHY